MDNLVADLVVFHPGAYQVYENVMNFQADPKEPRRITFDFLCETCGTLHHMEIFGSPYSLNRHPGHAKKAPKSTAGVN